MKIKLIFVVLVITSNNTLEPLLANADVYKHYKFDTID